MRFHHRVSILLLSLSVAASALPAVAKPTSKACVQHADCGSESQYCRNQKCVELGQHESYLSIFLTAPAPAPTMLYIDGTMVGELPWEGVVAPSVHAIRVECQGMQPLDLQGASDPGMMESIPLTMQPLPAAPAPGGYPAGAPSGTSGDGGRGVPGMAFVAATGGIGEGTAFMKQQTRAATTLVFGGAVGLGIPKLPIWVDLGVGAFGTMTRFSNYPVDGRAMKFTDLVKLDLALLVRVLFPIKKNFFYLGGEVEPGFAISNQNWIYADVRLAMSLFANELFEIRINPVGGEFAQSLAKENSGYIISYQATVGLVVRFPKKPLF
jgi:hypothetical protein